MEQGLPQDYVVVATVLMPGSGEMHSVIYDFRDDSADVVPVALPEDTRWYGGVQVAWRKEQTWELMQRAPSGEWGAVDLGEVRGVIIAELEGGVALLSLDGQPLGRLVNVGQIDHFQTLDRATMNRRLGHVGMGRGARLLHDGDLIYRIIKDKPELREHTR